MTDSATAAAGGSNNTASGEIFDRKKEMAEYEAEKKIIKDAISKRAKILAELSHLENKIVDLEGRYLESTPSGNIMTGFDNYTKGLTGAAAQRRKVGNAEQNRVFSRSSVSYNALNVSGALSDQQDHERDSCDCSVSHIMIADHYPQQEAPTPASGTSTPGAPTPVSTAFGNNKDRGPSDAPTPSSTTTEKKTIVNKKKKEKANAAEDSETDSKADSKKRTHFGANARK